MCASPCVEATLHLDCMSIKSTLFCHIAVYRKLKSDSWNPESAKQVSVIRKLEVGVRKLEFGSW